MNTQDQDALRWKLQALRQDIQPEADLWPGIAAGIAAATSQQATLARAAPARRFAPWAMAASVLLAVGFIWQLTPASDPAPVSVTASVSPSAPSPHSAQANPGIRKQAISMTLDYEGALARMQHADTHPELHAALGDLDRSAAQILDAIDTEPNARFLLDQLRRTYARRLQLTQRAVMAS